MTAQKHTCISITCDACDYTHDQDEDGTTHYTDIPEALTSDWFITDNGRVLCGETDEDHLNLAREWTASLTPDELAVLYRVYPTLKPEPATHAERLDARDRPTGYALCDNGDSTFTGGPLAHNTAHADCETCIGILNGDLPHPDDQDSTP